MTQVPKVLDKKFWHMFNRRRTLIDGVGCVRVPTYIQGMHLRGRASVGGRELG